jgi:hypothetical protein
MTDTPGWGPAPGQPAQQDTPEYQAAAGQAVGQVQADPGTDAGDSIDAMKQAAVRAALTDFERQLQQTLADAAAQRDDLKAQIDTLMRQVASVRAQAGPPMHHLLADAIGTRLASIAAANPDLGNQHFAGVADQAARLADTVKGLDEGGTVGEARRLGAAVGTWLHRAHPRASTKKLEGADILADELERLDEELAQLEAEARTPAKA